LDFGGLVGHHASNVVCWVTGRPFVDRRVDVGVARSRQGGLCRLTKVDILLINICNRAAWQGTLAVHHHQSHHVCCPLRPHHHPLSPALLFLLPVHSLFCIQRLAVPYLCPVPRRWGPDCPAFGTGDNNGCRKCSLANGAVPPLSKGEKSVFKMLYPWKIN